MSAESEKRQQAMMQVVPEHWDKNPMVLGSEIKRFLVSVKDEGTEVDSGGMDGEGDLWVTVGGIEYFINIKKSNGQLLKEGHSRESLGLPPLGDITGKPDQPES